MSKIAIARRVTGLGLLSVIAAGCLGDTDNATNVTTTSARLNGHGRPDGGAVWIEYYFKWGKTTAYGNKTPTVTISQPLNETIDYPVWADITGLEQAQTYHFTVCGRDSNDNWNTSDGFFCGADKTFTTLSIVADAGFEGQTTSAIQSPWITEGPDAKGIDLQGFAHGGSKNAWFNYTAHRWNAIRQAVAVEPNTNYALTAWVRNDNGSWGATTGEVGVREPNNVTVIANQRFGNVKNYSQIRLDFNSGSQTSIIVYVGMRGLAGINTWMRVDDVVLNVVGSGPGAINPAPEPPVLTVAPPSAFAGAVEETVNTVVAKKSHGDLWPACWGNDDMVYTANGDGTGFGGTGSHDVVVSRVSGSPYDSPPMIFGDTLASEGQVASVWSGNNYNRKPTGMLCLGSDLYLAVQDLRKQTFDHAPAASISVSHNRGFTWSWNTAQPMFSGGVFTTMFFLDFGKGGANAFDDNVYVYGIDNNWYAQANLYLARVPKTSIQDRSQWTFFAGISNGEVLWTPNIAQRVPVLSGTTFFGGIMSQGSVVYNPYFGRYLYTTSQGADGCCNIHRIYEAPAPWGPWTILMDKFFPAPFTASFHGGYAATTPSPWIRYDGRVMMLQSNYWETTPKAYEISLRRVTLTPAP